MKHIRKFVQKAVFLIIILAPTLALGAIKVDIPPGGSVPHLPIDNAEEVGDLIANIANFMGSLILAISVIVILYAGFKFLTAGEEEEAITGARKMITWGIVGIIVALVAYSIPGLVGNITGV